MVSNPGPQGNLYKSLINVKCLNLRTSVNHNRNHQLALDEVSIVTRSPVSCGRL